MIFEVQNKKLVIKTAILSLAFIGLAVWFYTTYSCLPPVVQKPMMGKHGWEIWAGNSFLSFRHSGGRYCIKEGWEPIGASTIERGGATFPTAATGILVKSADFISLPIPLERTDFTLRGIFPAQMSEEERAAYFKIVQQAYNDVSTLYPNQDSNTPQPQTAFVTVGIAGDGSTFETSVYPRPSEQISVLARNISNPRGEDLFIHAATHAYNRFNNAFQTYQNNQSPLPASDFEEIEATWSEITFGTSQEQLLIRVMDLYKTYQAVMNNSYSPDNLFPLNDKQLFLSIRNKSLTQSNSSTLGENEFGHYILAPLVMLSIEGLLEQHHSPADINSLLLQVHTTNQNFFELLKAEITPEEMVQVMRYIKGEELIPEVLLEKGLSRH